MGWLSSVSLMQEISENLLAHGSLVSANQLARGRRLPPWFTEILTHSKNEDRAWWHVYLDNFAAGERIVPSQPSTWGRLCHEAAEACWNRAGVAMSQNKRKSQESIVTGRRNQWN